MKHFTAATFFVALLTIPALGQTSAQQESPSPCTLTVTKAPVIRGLRLGMSTDEALVLFPGARESQQWSSELKRSKEPASLGFLSLQLPNSDYQLGESIKEIRYLVIRLLDDRVVGYSVTYQRYPIGADWNSTEEWVTKLSETLGLPEAKQWATKDSGRFGSRSLQCNGFEIEANYSNGPSISVFTKVDKELQERRKAHEEQKRREFKP
jgi:hypothetical protein